MNKVHEKNTTNSV